MQLICGKAKDRAQGDVKVVKQPLLRYYQELGTVLKDYFCVSYLNSLSLSLLFGFSYLYFTSWLPHRKREQIIWMISNE